MITSEHHMLLLRPCLLPPPLFNSYIKPQASTSTQSPRHYQFPTFSISPVPFPHCQNHREIWTVALPRSQDHAKLDTRPLAVSRGA